MTIRRSRIPILDIAKYYESKNARAVFVEELRVACHTVGFFLIRHDFGKLATSMLEETKSFFQHPLDDKLSISYEKSPSFRGYMPMGVENTSGKIDNREQVEYAVEYKNKNNNNSKSSNNRKSKAWPVYQRLKAEKNPWPTQFQPTLEATCQQYSAHVCAVANIIRDSLCLALQLPPTAIHDKFNIIGSSNNKTNDGDDNNDDDNNEVPHWVIKLVSYPPLPPPSSPSILQLSSDNDKSNDRNESEQQQQQQQHHHQGVGAHTDTNFLTLVLQDSSTSTITTTNNDFNGGGLQAYSQGEWIDVVVPSSQSCSDSTSSSNHYHHSDSDSDSTTTTTTTNANDCNHNCSYLICNLGEQAETWSRGYFLATPHRVIMKSSSTTTPPVSASASASSASFASSRPPQPRTSVPFFYNPVLSATMGPLELDDDDNNASLLFQNLPWERPRDYDQDVHWRRPNNQMNPSVGENTFKSLARSHPQVFARHHSDLELLEDGRIILRRKCPSSSSTTTTESDNSE